ncbi:hypothetical protein KJ660_02230, partial [Candidatus Micrarchaeota archaeon]|nr:hypothetical protein [Candidatus Micrarchaeota archaeon]
PRSPKKRSGRKPASNETTLPRRTYRVHSPGDEFIVHRGRPILNVRNKPGIIVRKGKKKTLSENGVTFEGPTININVRGAGEAAEHETVSRRPGAERTPIVTVPPEQMNYKMAEKILKSGRQLTPHEKIALAKNNLEFVKFRFLYEKNKDFQKGFDAFFTSDSAQHMGRMHLMNNVRSFMVNYNRQLETMLDKAKKTQMNLMKYEEPKGAGKGLLKFAEKIPILMDIPDFRKHRLQAYFKHNMVPRMYWRLITDLQAEIRAAENELRRAA